MAGGERVVVRTELAPLGIQVADQLLLPPRLERLVGEDVVFEPADAELGGGKLLEGAVGEPRRAGEERVGVGCAPRAVHHRRGRPLPARDVRGRLGREVLRVDRDLGAALLQQARGRQPHRAAAEHREARLSGLPRLVHGKLRRAPGQRDPAAAVAVVVDHGLVADLLRAHHEARRPERTEADDRPDDAVLGYVHAREAARGLQRDERAGPAARARGEPGAERGEAGRLEHGPPRHLSRDHRGW